MVNKLEFHGFYTKVIFSILKCIQVLQCEKNQYYLFLYFCQFRKWIINSLLWVLVTNQYRKSALKFVVSLIVKNGLKELLLLKNKTSNWDTHWFLIFYTRLISHRVSTNIILSFLILMLFSSNIKELFDHLLA